MNTYVRPCDPNPRRFDTDPYHYGCGNVYKSAQYHRGYAGDDKGRGMTSICITARRVSQVIVLTAALVPWAAKAADASASPSPQVRRGEEVAQLKCSACHVVAEQQKYPPLLEDPAPSFRSIASRPQTSEAALRHFVATTHWDQQTAPRAMPNPGLSKTDIAAVIRYLLSLKGR
jgi:mono/diheme cytochrome c family protein